MNDGFIIEIPNIALDSTKSFQMGAHHLTLALAGKEDQIRAIWHTHPKGSRVPSYTDLEAISKGHIWPTWTYIIATKEDIFIYDTNVLAPQDNSFWSAYLK